MLPKTYLIILVCFLTFVGFFYFTAIFLDFNFSFLGQKQFIAKISDARQIPVPIVIPALLPSQESKKILFVGDIMLDRGVEFQSKKNNNDFYPFEKIAGFLEAFDLTAGNLEGPIVANPGNFPDSSLQFAFTSTSAGVLDKAGFDILSLANNHTLNMGKQGLTETKWFLGQSGIDFIGDPVYCKETSLYQEDGVIVLGFNTTFPFNCNSSDITEIIESKMASSSDDFLVVFMHWGNEYQLKNSSIQQAMARQIIDAGADLIIGSHPHVVQNIEEYNGKLIFYSLGNFVFDQSFSSETSQGLAVGLEIQESQTVFSLFPVAIVKAQVFLMQDEEARIFLESLSGRSNPQLLDEVKRGIIIKSNI